MRDLIPDELKRIIYQSMMGDKMVVISSDDERSVKYFKELKEAVSIASEELQVILEKAEREIIRGRTNGKDPIGIMAEYFEVIEELPTSNPMWQRKWYNPGKWRLTRKARESAIVCRRCRWRPRESRKSLEGLSPRVVVDELEVE